MASEFPCYFEIWLRGFAKDYLRERANLPHETYHPHVTLVRPFRTDDCNRIQSEVERYCTGKQPIPFSLEGCDKFEQGVIYVPVIATSDLLDFDSGLEQLLADQVTFARKFDDSKKFHATVGREHLHDFPRIDQYMLRLTGVKDKKIWFSYDFVLQRSLTREESLCKKLWYRTVHQFSENTGLLPTRNGFRQMAASK